MEILQCPEEVQCIGDSSCAQPQNLEKISQGTLGDCQSQINNAEEITFVKDDFSHNKPKYNILDDVCTINDNIQDVHYSQQSLGLELYGRSQEGNSQFSEMESIQVKCCDMRNDIYEDNNSSKIAEVELNEGTELRRINNFSCSDFLYSNHSNSFECEEKNQVKHDEKFMFQREEGTVVGISATIYSGNETEIEEQPSCTGETPLFSSKSDDFNSDFNEQKQEKETSLLSHNFSSMDNPPEGGPQDNNLGHDFENRDTGHGDDRALWVKRDGQWQVGIRCLEEDYPLTVLGEKRSDERKNYFVVFFPHTRTYFWTDSSLVRSINESPEQLALDTHYDAVDMVKDLSLPHNYIMEKLAVSMLDIRDKLPKEALLEGARSVSVWNEFSLQVSHCKSYSDLGKMVMKLQSMILPKYIDADWIQHSFKSWAEQCPDTNSAESIEILIEEFSDSILWDEIENLCDSPLSSKVGTEWRTWKEDVIKYFPTLYPPVNVEIKQNDSFDYHVNITPQSVQKRPKLEVRRADIHSSSQPEVGISGFDSQSNELEFTDKTFAIDTECKPLRDTYTEIAVAEEYPRGVDDKWGEIVVEAQNLEFNQSSKISVSTPTKENNDNYAVAVVQEVSHSEKKYRQCIAFIESKGRQCVRWANDGSVYCCIHLNTRSNDTNISKEQTPLVKTSLCEGTTTHGKKCKHHARIGSVFCKKHRLQHVQTLMGNNESSISSLKRKDTDDAGMHKFSNSQIVKSRESISQEACLVPSSKTLCEKDETKEKSGHLMIEETRCIIWCDTTGSRCKMNAKFHKLYCENHLPNWLKRARNGKSRIISKDVFFGLLRTSTSQKQKEKLHLACELLYRFMKNSLSRKHSVSKDDLMKWVLSEATKDTSIGDLLLEIVSLEKERLCNIWGFNLEKDAKQISSSTIQPMHNTHASIRCKICSEDFSDDQSLGAHWMDYHKKEAQWLYRGYACAICSSSFTNRKVLETHVIERHGAESLEKCILFRCMPCSKHFMNPDQLWSHVLSQHLMDFRLTITYQKHHQTHNVALVSNSLNMDEIIDPCQSLNISQRFSCRICGLRFDLLPDLGRHHQAAHMNQTSYFPPKKENYFRSSQMRRTRIRHARFKKGLTSTFRMGNASRLAMKKHFHASTSIISSRAKLQLQASNALGLDKLDESHCKIIARTLFSEIQKTKPRPHNHEVLSMLQTACCKINLHNSLEEKYGTLTKGLYLKAAKVCSEMNIPVEWHRDDFICPKGCVPIQNSNSTNHMFPHLDNISETSTCVHSSDIENGSEWDVDESHYIISLKDLKPGIHRNSIVLCKDISFGYENVPVLCVVDVDLKNANEEYGSQSTSSSVPWKDFTYVTRCILGAHIDLFPKSSQLGCACEEATCHAGKCDHVYLFENDYEDAVDIHGKAMHGRFPYDERGKVILQKGYLIYECNSLCPCDKTCQNRVLQNGLQVKLEVFKTLKKGWAIRAGEAISGGTFICEYVGEILSDEEAKLRRARYNDGCSYMFCMDLGLDNMSGFTEDIAPHVIDATKYGNVSRFINHSCSPNLVHYRVLVDSMECQLAHIGLFASRDISVGEELTFDYRDKSLPGPGPPCHCDSSYCRGCIC